MGAQRLIAFVLYLSLKAVAAADSVKSQGGIYQSSCDLRITQTHTGEHIATDCWELHVRPLITYQNSLLRAAGLR
jgi:hypothetical protein